MVRVSKFRIFQKLSTEGSTVPEVFKVECTQYDHVCLRYLSLHGEAQSYCFPVRYVPESIFNYFL